LAAPTAVSTGTSQPKDGLWHDAQLMLPTPDRRGSKNSALPSDAFSRV
jgi:hypothetical protein